VQLNCTAFLQLNGVQQGVAVLLASGSTKKRELREAPFDSIVTMVPWRSTFSEKSLGFRTN